MHYSRFHSNYDSFTVSLLVALAFHAAVGLGIGFVLDFRPLTHPLETLDVVLVNWQSETKPDEADFLAQASQQGGGESTEASRPSQENTGASPGPTEGSDALDQQEQASSVADAAREQILIEDNEAEFSQQITSIAQPEPILPRPAKTSIICAGELIPKNGKICMMMMIIPIPLIKPEITGYGM